MAGYDFNVGDIIDPQAIQDIQKLGDSFEKAKDQYIGLAKEFGKGLKIDVSSIATLIEKEERFKKLESELAETQSKLNKVQEEYTSIVRKVADELAKKNKEVESAKKASKEQTVSEDELAKALNRTANSVKQATEQIKVLEKAQAQLIGGEQDSLVMREQINKKLAETIAIQKELKTVQGEVAKASTDAGSEAVLEARILKEQQLAEALNKTAKSEIEAISQNKVLVEARKQITVEDENWKQKVGELNDKISENIKVIKEFQNAKTESAKISGVNEAENAELQKQIDLSNDRILKIQQENEIISDQSRSINTVSLSYSELAQRLNDLKDIDISQYMKSVSEGSTSSTDAVNTFSSEIAKARSLQEDYGKALSKGLITYSQYNTAILQTETRVKELNTAFNSLQGVTKETGESVKEIANESFNNLTTALQGQIKAITDLTLRQTEVRDAIKELDKEYKVGRISVENYTTQKSKLITLELQIKNSLKEASREFELNKKVVDNALSSYNRLSAQHELLVKRINALGEEEEANVEQKRKLEQQANKLYQQMKLLEKAMGGTKLSVGDYTDSIKKAVSEMNAAGGSGNAFTDTLNKIGRTASDISTKGLKLIGDKLSHITKRFIQVHLVYQAFQLLQKGVSGAVDTILDFEDSAAKLAVTLGKSVKDISSLTNLSKELAKQSRYTAIEILEMQTALASFGYTKNQVEQSTEAVLNFARATRHDAKEAGELASIAIRGFGASTLETSRYVSTMAVATKYSAATVDFFRNTLKNVAPAAESVGFQIEDVAALLGTLANTGMDASNAGTSLHNLFIRLADPTSKLSQAIGKPVKSLEDLIEGFIKLREQGVNLSDIVGLTDKRTAKLFETFLSGAENIMELRNQITGADDEFVKMGEDMDNTTRAALDRLKGSWDSFVLTIAESTGWLRDFFNALSNGLDFVSRKFGLFLNSWEDTLEKQTQIQATEISKQSGLLKKYTDEYKKLYDEQIKKGAEKTKAQEIAKEKVLQLLKEEKDGYQGIADAKLKSDKNMIQSAQTSSKVIVGTTTATFAAIGSIVPGLGTLVGAGLGALTGATLGVIGTGSREVMTENIANAQGYVKVLGDIEEEINGMDFTSKKTKDGLDPEATKAELNKIRKLWEIYYQSQINMQEDSIKKELELIRQNFGKRIREITGNSELEKKVREQLTEEMNNELAKKVEEHELKVEESNLKNKLSFAKKGTLEELNLRLASQKIIHERLKEEAKKHGLDMEILEGMNARAIEKIYEEHGDERVKIITDSYAQQATKISTELADELAGLDALFQTGTSYEDFLEQRRVLLYEYSRKTIEATINMNEEILQNEDLTTQQRLKFEEALAKARKSLYDLDAAEYKKVNKIKESELSKWMKKNEKELKVLGQLFSEVGNFIGQIFDNQVASIDRLIEKNQEAYDREIEQINLLQDSKIISDEEAEARKRAAADETARKERELQREKVAVQRRQAKYEKAAAMASIVMNTAAAVIKNIATVGLPYAIPLNILTIALGAVQLATVAAKPLPQYAEGTDFHKGGLAVVGDGGKHEAVINKQGKVWITPNVPTIIDMKRGSQVLPDVSKFDMSDLRSDLAIILNKDKDDSIIRIDNNFSPLEKSMDNMVSMYKKSMRESSKMNYRIHMETVRNAKRF